MGNTFSVAPVRNARSLPSLSSMPFIHTIQLKAFFTSGHMSEFKNGKLDNINEEIKFLFSPDPFSIHKTAGCGTLKAEGSCLSVRRLCNAVKQSEEETGK